jgi:hypothetical protein
MIKSKRILKKQRNDQEIIVRRGKRMKHKNQSHLLKVNKNNQERIK